jgi:hypothetical protein
MPPLFAAPSSQLLIVAAAQDAGAQVLLASVHAPRLHA